MDKQININLPIADIIEQQPEVLEILVELGFKTMANPDLRRTVGRATSIRTGAEVAGLDLGQIKAKLEAEGYCLLDI